MFTLIFSKDYSGSNIEKETIKNKAGGQGQIEGCRNNSDYR